MYRLFSGHGRAGGSACPVVLDRRGERRVLHQLLDAVRAGESRALVVCGELGVGKTVLLDHLVEQAWGCRVERVSGVRVGDGPGLRRVAPAVRVDAGPGGAVARSAP